MTFWIAVALCGNITSDPAHCLQRRGRHALPRVPIAAPWVARSRPNPLWYSENVQGLRRDAVLELFPRNGSGDRRPRPRAGRIRRHCSRAPTIAKIVDEDLSVARTLERIVREPGGVT